MGFQLRFDGARWNASGSALAVISNFAKRQAGRPLNSVRAYRFARFRSYISAYNFGSLTLRDDCCLFYVTRKKCVCFVSQREREREETVPLLRNAD